MMNCLENENVCSVKKENNLGYYRLHSIWKNEGFFLNVASKDGAWRGEMKANDVKKMSMQLDMEPDAYLKHCREALTHHDGQPGISYAVENGTFTWKKIVDEDSGIKIKMGSILLQPASFVDTIQNLVTAALDCNKKLLKEMKELSQEKEKNVANRNELCNELEDLIKAKDAMENDLYTKFILLLNAKKKKIDELESLVRNMTKNKQARSRKGVVEMSYANPYEVDTENDECDSNGASPPANKVKKIKRRSTRLKIKNSARKKISQSGKSSKEVNVNESLPSSSNCLQNLETLKKRKSGMPSTNDELLDFFYGT